MTIDVPPSPPASAPPPPPGASSRPMEASRERTWAMLCHLTALSSFIGVPFGHLLGPLVVWLIKKDQSPLVDANGKESLNFQLSMTIYAIVSGILILVLIGIPMLVGVILLDIICTIIASVKASNGEPFKYPLSIRFLK